MAYTDLATLEKIVPEADITALTDDRNTGAINTDVLNEAILNADTIIDSYLRVKYTLPLSTTPQLIRKISSDLTIVNLYERRNAAKVPEFIQLKKDEAMKLLKQLGQGEIAVDSDEATGHGGEYRTNKTAADRQFSNAKTWDKY